MTTEDSDLADFLKREDDKLAEIEISSLVRSSPPPDTNGVVESTTPDSGRMSPLQILSEDSEPPFVASPEPPVRARRSSITLSPPRAASTELNDSREDMYSAVTQDETLFAGGEPECIQTWKLQKEEMLDQKEVAASEEMRRWRESAQEELRDWYDHHNGQVETRKQDNRAAEEAFISERDQSVPGTEWEKVANLCEFSGKAPGKTSKDVTRMRSIYLHLKENPPIRNL